MASWKNPAFFAPEISFLITAYLLFYLRGHKSEIRFISITESGQFALGWRTGLATSPVCGGETLYRRVIV
jgi:hypothetical protein